jgi:hypothetical protein
MAKFRPNFVGRAGQLCLTYPQSQINKLASNQMALMRERQKRQYDIKINKTQYPVGSLVWLHDPTKKNHKYCC